MSLRLGLIAPKNTLAEQQMLLGQLTRVESRPYTPSEHYDVVWCLNLVEEIARIRRYFDTKIVAVGMEPRAHYPLNYDTSLISMCDVYVGYTPCGATPPQFRQFYFPVNARRVIAQEFPESFKSIRPNNFCIIAHHDPNCRRAAGLTLSRHGAILAGTLFGKRLNYSEKLAVQRSARFEFISENDITDFYLSEKLGQSLLAGCVPIYYGCSRAVDLFPESTFVDASKFSRCDGTIDFEQIAEYCLAPGVYERYRHNIQQLAFDILLAKCSIEGCIISPIQEFVDQLQSTNWRSKAISIEGRLRLLKNQLSGRTSPAFYTP